MSKKDLGPRYDFHTHSVLSDGCLLPSEIIRRVEVKGTEAIAITDHVDFSNVDFVIDSLKRVIEEEGKSFKVKLIPGVEITHVPLDVIPRLAEYARKRGAKIIVAHGESPVEPVIPGTNKVSAGLKGLVDIIAHPGYIADADAALAAENNICLEITSRRGHKKGNVHVAKAARRTGAKLLVNTDAHEPEDLLTQRQAYSIAKLAGLTDQEAKQALTDNPIQILRQLP
jgi:histidinol phosphatase-like PHP family hydrolase